MSVNPTGKKDPGSEDLVFGKNAVKAVLDSLPEHCSVVLVSERMATNEREQFLETCRRAGVRWHLVPPSRIDRICPGDRHQGIAARMLPVALTDLESFLKGLDPAGGPSLIVLLDHVQDPQNLGAIARSAEIFGADGMVIPRRRSVLPTSTVMRTSSGAIARVPVVGVVNVVRTLEDLKGNGFWVVGLDHRKGSVLWECDLPERMVLVVGSEDRGMSRLTSETCDLLTRVPMKGRTGSLNASTAAAIGMYEWMRSFTAGCVVQSVKE